MAQTLQLPVLSLAMPSAHNMDSMDAYSLSCMWNIFSKCKNNLENGRRLENMSWRLWYRETTLKSNNKIISSKVHSCLSSQSCVTINDEESTPSEKEPVESILVDQEVSKSFKDMNANCSTSIDNNPVNHPVSSNLAVEIACSNVISYNESVKRSSKFFIDDDDDDDDSKEEEFESDYSKPFYIGSDDEYEDIETGSDCESFETFDEPTELSDDNRVDEAAFMIEFRKRSPCNNVFLKGQSLLTTLLRTQAQYNQAEPSSTIPSRSFI
ncbi:hypothetical protein A0J61_08395 [Choanephora cucurbitarum]|uniref:Nitrogen regulatory protein areA GATA-like domain-containing protein n=1 Tax=Choanephora cucurbitarum TaxID=101091 RepID=A0A1C7N3E7_9FUNG|nr:hypothetical protein A0J61_08395 [Choanephora cucurbitarum]